MDATVTVAGRAVDIVGTFLNTRRPPESWHTLIDTSDEIFIVARDDRPSGSGSRASLPGCTPSNFLPCSACFDVPNLMAGVFLVLDTA